MLLHVNSLANLHTIVILWVYIFVMTQQLLDGQGFHIMEATRTHSFRQTTLRRAPLDEWSARRSTPYLKQFYILLTFMWPCIVNVFFLSITNKMQRYTIFFITANALHVSVSFSAHHQELKTVCTASGICQACLLLPLAWVSSNSSTLAVAADAVCKVLSSWWWTEKPPGTCSALTVIKNIV
jgi:hypothetical protein